MHGRHRNSGNGYRFGPEGAGRARGSGNRLSRGFGRRQGHLRPFLSPQPSPRRGGDILVEAGRLATEYLVSKGMLSPNALSGKWPNGSFVKQGKNFQEYRGEGSGDGMQFQSDIRMSGNSQVGNTDLNPGSDRRRYDDDYSPGQTRNYGEGSRRGGTFRGYGASDWGKEYGRNSMSSDRAKGYVASGHAKDPEVEKDDENVTGMSGKNESVLKADGFECVIGKHDLADKLTLKEGSSSGAEMGSLTEADGELSKDSKNFDGHTEKAIDDTASEKFEVKAEEDLSVESPEAEGNHSDGSCAHSLSFFNSVKVPTRIRSPLTSRISKVGPVSKSEDEHKSNIGPQISDSVQGSSVDAMSHMSINYNSKAPESDVKKAFSQDFPGNEKELGVAYGIDQDQHKDTESAPNTKNFSVQSAENAGNADPVGGIEQSKCTRSQSFPVSKTTHGQPIQCMDQPNSAFVINESIFFRSNSFPEKDFFRQDNQEESSYESPSCATVQERPEKRALEYSNTESGTKKLREWITPVTKRSDEHLQFSNLIEKIENSKAEGNSIENKLPVNDSEESLVNNSEFPKHGGGSCLDYAQEKQFFPDLCKIYDAPSMDTSHPSGSHYNNPSLLYPSISGTKKEIPIDINLSMTSNKHSQYSRRLSDGKEIEVIDLEDDSAEDDNPAENVEMTRRAVFSDMEAFSNNTPSSGVITGVQDNYDGLMISEFFNSFQNCPPPAGINSLPNEMGVPNVEGTLGDDSTMNMSLDEIPIGFLRAWEQPPSSREYDKHF